MFSEIMLNFIQPFCSVLTQLLFLSCIFYEILYKMPSFTKRCRNPKNPSWSIYGKNYSNNA